MPVSVMNFVPLLDAAAATKTGRRVRFCDAGDLCTHPNWRSPKGAAFGARISEDIFFPIQNKKMKDLAGLIFLV